MNLQEIIQSWPDSYNKELEDSLISYVNDLEASSLTEELVDLLAFSITDHYNDLAKKILEKDFKGKKINLFSINQSIINQSNDNYSLLHFATQFGNKELFIYLLLKNLAITTDKDSQTPFHILAFSKNLKKADYVEILEAATKIYPKIIFQLDNFKKSAIDYATSNNNDEYLEALKLYQTSV